MDVTYFARYLNEVKGTIEKLPLHPIAKATQLLKNAHQLKQRVWLVGNGGSAATAIHFATDLQKVCGIDALAIPAQISTITAYGNDIGWARMFSSAMKSFQVGDILVAISFSGLSENVLEAAKFALACDGRLIVLTRGVWDGNVLGKMSGIIIPVDHEDIKVVEDVHLAICHSIVGAIYAMSSLQENLLKS